jgi:hypothetical protein
MELRQPLLSAFASRSGGRGRPLWGKNSGLTHTSARAALSIPMGLRRPAGLYPRVPPYQGVPMPLRGPHKFTAGPRIGASLLGEQPAVTLEAERHCRQQP